MVGQPLFGQQTGSASAKQRLAQALMQQGSSQDPVGSWTQGLARMANGYEGGRLQNQINQGQIGGSGSIPTTSTPPVSQDFDPSGPMSDQAAAWRQYQGQGQPQGQPPIVGDGQPGPGQSPQSQQFPHPGNGASWQNWLNRFGGGGQ